jgi:hypothetical protein
MKYFATATMKYYFFSFCIIVFQKKYKEKKLKNKLQKNKDKNKKIV